MKEEQKKRIYFKCSCCNDYTIEINEENPRTVSMEILEWDTDGERILDGITAYLDIVEIKLMTDALVEYLKKRNFEL